LFACFWIYCIAGVLSADEWELPLPDDASPVITESGSSELQELYAYKTSLGVEELFRFYSERMRERGFFPMQREQSDGLGVPEGQMVFFDGENALISIRAQYKLEGEGAYEIKLTYIPDVRAAKAARAASRRAQRELDAETSVGAEVVFSDELDAIRDAINLRDFDGLYAMASPWFRNCFPDRLVREQLQWLYVDELTPLRAIRREHLATVVVQYRCQGRTGESQGVAILYFDEIDGGWRFNNLPFGQFEMVLPDRMTRAFSE